MGLSNLKYSAKPIQRKYASDFEWGNTTAQLSIRRDNAMNLELIILEGPQAGLHVPVGPVTVTFGRSPEASVSFPEDIFMSGTHLKVHAAPGGAMLADQHSTNGSFLNGRRITEAIARPGDVVKIGSLTMQVATEVVSFGRPVPPPVQPPKVPIAAVPVATPSPTQKEPVLSVLRMTETPLFCLLDIAAAEMIPSLLALAQERMELLHKDDSAGGLAPCLLQLSPDSALLGVLVENGWGYGWASYFTSEASFEDSLKHFRKLFTVQLDEGKEVYFRFYNPRVLREFFSNAVSQDIATVFGPVTEWLIEGESKSELLKIRNASDGLQTVIVPVS
jgi:hypothetical protein